MNARTTILLSVMAIMIGAWIGDQFGLLAFLDGTSEGESELQKIARQIEKADEIILQGAHAGEALSKLEAGSLPFDPQAAALAYQTWLVDLVETTGIRKPTVAVDSPPSSMTVKDGEGKKREAYKVYSFTINGEGTLDNVTRFLFSFYRAGHLHKITSLSMTPGASMFSLSVRGEAISVATCDRKTELSDAVGTSLHHDNLQDYAAIVRRNVFSRDGTRVLKSVTLSSVTFDKTGQPEAWFQLGSGTRRLQREGKLTLSVHQIHVLDIQPLSVLLELDGQILDLSIGQSLHDALRVTAETDLSDG